MKNLNDLRDKAYQCAVVHGWHEHEYSNEHFLCLVISELMEAVEADWKGSHADFEAFNKYYNRIDFKENFERQIKGTVEGVKSKELSRKNLPTPASDCWIWPD